MSLPLFPVTTVGSWPRPPELLRAFSLRHRRELGLREFDQVADRAVLASLRAQEHAGADLVTDGEQRRDNFYSFVAEKLDGVQMMTLSEMLDVVEDKQGFARLLATLDVPAFSIRNPTCVGRIQRREPLAVDDFEFLRRHTDRPIKITLPGPYLLTRAMWVKEVSRAFYPSKEDLGEDVVRLLRDEILELKKAGVAFIQLDEPVLTELVFTQGNTRTFMCAALAARKDPAEELAFAVSLINRVIEPIVDQGIRCSSDGGAMRTSNVERPIVGLHVCRGNWSQDEATLLRGSYHPLASYFAQMNVDQLVLEYATPRAGDFVPVDGKSIGLGVVNPRDPRIESAQSVVDRASAVLQHVAPDKLFLNPDCGFATFTSRAMNSAEVAAGKIAAMAEAAAVLRAGGTGHRAQGTGHRAAPAPAPEP
jgi:5-methyltetrahydropteroyltriglutamate--homocysteine methyltransferase